MSAKRVLILVAATMILSALPVTAAKEIPDVVAVVNGEKITKGALTAILYDWMAEMVLEEMIDERIVGQAARKAGVAVTVDDVKAKMEEAKKQLRPGQTLEEALRGMGMTPGHYFARLKMQMQMERVLRKQIEVTPVELDAYLKASHILIRVPYSSDAEEKKKKEEEAKKKIESIAQEIKEGLAFEEAAKKYSDDRANKDKGGDLGFFTKGRMAPEFEEAASKLKPGEISEPVKTTFGYHLIKLVKTGKEADKEERAELEERIMQQQVGQQWRDWLLSTKNAAEVDNKLSPKKPEPKPAPPAPTEPTKSAPAPSEAKPAPQRPPAPSAAPRVGPPAAPPAETPPEQPPPPPPEPEKGSTETRPAEAPPAPPAGQ